MGKYTFYDNKSVDLEIERRLNIVVDSILKYLNNNVESILLTGGYGRGEGSVIIRNNKIILLKDFDIAIIVNKIPDETTTSLMLEDIYKKLGSDNPALSLFKYSNFALDLRYLTINNINFPDIWFVDLKNSTVLYGKDIRPYITYNGSDIPLSSGARLLFEKITGLLGHFEYKMLYNNIDDNSKMRLIYECMKTYVEIATVICILYKSYISSYSKRLEIVKMLNSEGKLEEIIRKIPDLIDKIEVATRFKLSPDYSAVNDPIEFFFTTRNDLITTIQYYIKYYINLDMKNWLDINRLSNSLAKVYYKPMLDAWFRNKFCIKPILLSSLLNRIYQLYTNFIYVKIIRNHLSKLYLYPLIHNGLISPSLKFFPAGLLILMSLNRDGSYDKHLLHMAISILRRLIPIYTITSWEDARQAYLRTYKYYLFPTLLK
ncbi:MAG: hypothetical protein QXM92_02060 [Candidatus Anstonellales archaeon]